MRGRYLEELNAGLWEYAERRHAAFLERERDDSGRPPVFRPEHADRNVLVPEGDPERTKTILDCIRPGDRHRWFRSMKSSQALTQSVFGALIAYGRLDVLTRIEAECGRPAFFDDAGGWECTLEQPVQVLNEPRPTTLDVMLWHPDGRRVVVEAKLSEREFGGCSRRRLAPGEEGYCDGSYTHQQGRRTRCSLTEQGIAYWEHLPKALGWDAEREHIPCEFGQTYQLSRNVLAAQVRHGGERRPELGHATVVYDARNPALRGNGMASQQWKMVAGRVRPEGGLRKVSWENITRELKEQEDMQGLEAELKQKYGLNQREERR